MNFASLPIIQAPMAGSQDAALALAVSNAGGLGSLPAAMLSSAALREQLSAIRMQTTAQYNVNFFCHRNPTLDVQREQSWLASLAHYYAELGIAAVVANAPARVPFDAAALEVLRAFRPPVVSFHFGLPEPVLLSQVKQFAKVLSSATTVAEARWLEAHGVDAVIAQGVEAGGHRGMFLSSDLSTQAGTLALVPQVVRAVRVPVIAAGGIADRHGVAAALALGAIAAQVGTAYLLCPEARTSSVHREALRSDAAIHTTLTNLFTGRPARAIVNRLMRERGPLAADAPEFPLAASALVLLRARAESLGSGDFSPLWAGQNVSGCREVPGAQLTRELAGA
ncbi:MAG: nitronate monooxygenase [Steroidobacteraceae bacterium]